MRTWLLQYLHAVLASGYINVHRKTSNTSRVSSATIIFGPGNGSPMAMNVVLVVGVLVIIRFSIP